MTQFATLDRFVKFKPLEVNYLSRKNGLFIFLGLFFLFFIVDQVVELKLGATYSELLLDFLLELPRVILFMAILLLASFHLKQKGEKIKSLAEQLKAKQQNTLTKESKKWNLTKSETEILRLLLNGKSSKEMATKRFTSERTVRNHCQSIYDKSGLKGKHEVMAYFLNERP